MRARVALSIALLLAGAAYAQQPGWIADPGTGCRVWNANPIPNEHVSWTGSCVNGVANGRGALQWFVNKRPTERYEGELVNGREHGQGTYSWTNGARYEGAWREGKAHGQGTRTNQEGAAFSGELVNGCFEKDGRRSWVGVSRDDCKFK
jgi:hypothetical protein